MSHSRLLSRRALVAMLLGISGVVLVVGCTETPDALAARPVGGASTGDTGAAPALAQGPVLAARTGARDDASVVAESTTVVAPLLLPSLLYVERDAVVGARAAGVLLTLSVDLGSAVRAGQPVGQQEDGAQRLAVARAGVTLENIRRRVERARALRSANGITAAELEESEAELQMATVARREAEHALELTRVIAPFDGIVTGRYAQAGRLLARHDSVVRVTARGPHLARGRVPETVAADLSVGEEVTIVTRAGRRIASRVIRLSPAIDAASGTREFIAQVTGTRDLVIGSGVTLELSSATRRALTLPRTAIGDDGYVVVLGGARPTLRPVVTGARIGERVEIVSGLRAGERVRRVAR